MSASRAALALLFTAAGVLHFLSAEAYLRIVPPFFPNPHLLVLLSGGFEIAGGLGLLAPRLRRAAGTGLVLLLAAVFPANLYMALDPEGAGGGIAPALLWLRLPLQPLLAWWVWRASRD
ncbi:MAG: hypothetical protein AB1941_13845 [Gemmatimonadota bacterium]